MIGLDTNVLLRWLIDESVWPDDAPGQARAARDLIVESGETFFVNHVVLIEMAWVLLNPMGQPKHVLVEIVERLLSSSNVVVDRRDCGSDEDRPAARHTSSRDPRGDGGRSRQLRARQGVERVGRCGSLS